MPNWNSLLKEIQRSPSAVDSIRRKYLAKLHKKTGRNIIAYYSGWLQHVGDMNIHKRSAITDEDKTGFMTVIHGMKRELGLDLLLHTQGGEMAATESLVDYLRSMFGTDIRAIIPQIAMSGGTMIACASKEILMGRQSNLGPIDPQVMGVPAHGIIEEVKNAVNGARDNPGLMPIWQQIVAKIPLALLGECKRAVAWSETTVKEWLRTGMLREDPDKENKIEVIWKELGDQAFTLSHSRHVSSRKCREIFLNVSYLEDDHELQEAVLSVHHAFILTFQQTLAYKLIENQKGTAFVKSGPGAVAPKVMLSA